MSAVASYFKYPFSGATMSSAGESYALPAMPFREDRGDDDWHPEMAWAVPKHAKKRVNWAGKTLLIEAPDYFTDEVEVSEEYQAWIQEYLAALDIINNWRSSHNFPLNTFHIGLKRRAKIIDPTAITAQRIKRLASIEAKLRRFPTMTLSQMQDIGGCRAIVSSAHRQRDRLQTKRVTKGYCQIFGGREKDQGK